MMPDRQENKAYQYVRTVIETIRPDGVPVVFGLRRVPGAVERFSEYLEYIATGVDASMPHTGELKRAVREAFGSVRNSNIGDGTVPVLERDLTEYQREVIRRGIENIGFRIPKSTAAYWREVLAKWSRLFASEEYEDGGNYDEGEVVINNDGLGGEEYRQWEDEYEPRNKWNWRGLWERFAGNVDEKVQAVGMYCLWAAIAFALGFAACRYHIVERVKSAFSKRDTISQSAVPHSPAQPLIEYRTYVNCARCGAVLDISHTSAKCFNTGCPACGCQMIIERK